MDLNPGPLEFEISALSTLYQPSSPLLFAETDPDLTVTTCFFEITLSSKNLITSSVETPTVCAAALCY